MINYFNYFFLSSFYILGIQKKYLEAQHTSHRKVVFDESDNITRELSSTAEDINIAGVIPLGIMNLRHSETFR